MKKKFITILLIAITTTTINAQDIFGRWVTREDDNGIKGPIHAIMEIYVKDGKAFAKIIDIKDPVKRKRNCTDCKGINKDKPVLGMDVLTGLSRKGKEWSGGEILDPRKGKGTVYDCYIKLKGPNKLKIRGYIGISLFGRTVYWHRETEI